MNPFDPFDDQTALSRPANSFDQFDDLPEELPRAPMPDGLGVTLAPKPKAQDNWLTEIAYPELEKQRRDDKAIEFGKLRTSLTENLGKEQAALAPLMEGFEARSSDDPLRKFREQRIAEYQERLTRLDRGERVEPYIQTPFDNLVTGLQDPQQYVEVAKGVPSGGATMVGSSIQGVAGVQSFLSHGHLKSLHDRLANMASIDQGGFPDRLRDRSDSALTYYLTSPPEKRQEQKAALEQEIAQYKPTPVEERTLYKAGQSVVDFGKTLLPAAPGYEQAFGRQVGEGLGTMGMGLTMGLAGRIPAILSLSTAGSGEALQNAIAFDKKERAAGRPGVTEEEKATAALWGVGPGATDLLPIEMMLSKLHVPAAQRAALSKAVGRIGGQAMIEGAQEGGQQFLQNLIAQEVYNPNQNLSEGILSNAGMGGAVGGLAQTGVEAGKYGLKLMGKRSGRAGHPIEQVPDGAALPEAPSVESNAAAKGDMLAPEGARLPGEEAPQPAHQPAPPSSEPQNSAVAPESAAPAVAGQDQAPAASEAPVAPTEVSRESLQQDFSNYLAQEEQISTIPDDHTPPPELINNFIDAEESLVEKFKAAGVPGAPRQIETIDDIKWAFEQATPEELAQYWTPKAVEPAPAVQLGTTFQTSKGSVYTQHADGTTTRDKAYRSEHGDAEQGAQPRSQTTFYVSKEDAIKLGEFQTKGPAKAVAPLGDGRYGVKYTSGPDAGKFERRTVVTPQAKPGVGLQPVEIWQDGERVHFGNEIVAVSSGDNRAIAEAKQPPEQTASQVAGIIASRVDDILHERLPEAIVASPEFAAIASGVESVITKIAASPTDAQKIVARELPKLAKSLGLGKEARAAIGKFLRGADPAIGELLSEVAAIAERPERLVERLAEVTPDARVSARGLVRARVAQSLQNSGVPLRVVTPDNSMEVSVIPHIVELANLVHAEGALQVRDRSRKESGAEIRSRAANLDVEQLMPGRVADAGAPIVVSRSNGTYTIVSGNGRVGSLRVVYDDRRLSHKASAYKKRLGPEAEGYSQPVLVSVIDEDLSEEALISFAERANRGRIAEMSATEKALRDASVAGIDLVSMYQGGELTKRENQPFLQAFLKKVVVTQELGGMSKDGVLTKAGYDRINAAILASAYGDANVLSLMLESADLNIKSIANAYRDVAPLFMRLQAEIEAGVVRDDVDITPHMMQAARFVNKARDKGIKIADALAQVDAFNPMDVVTEKLIEQFYNEGMRRARSSVKIAEVLRFYAELALEKKTNDFFGDPTSAIDLIQAAARKLIDETGSDLFAFDEANSSGSIIESIQEAISAELSQAEPGTEGQPGIVQPDIEKVATDRAIGQALAELINGKTPASQWQAALGIDEETYQALIAEAVAKGWLRRDASGKIRRAPKTSRTDDIAAMVVGDVAPDTLPGIGPVVKTKAAEKRWDAAKAAVLKAAAKILPKSVAIDFRDNIEIMRLKKEDELLALAGVRSATANHAKLREAKEMAAQAVDRGTIWDKTGWYQGVDEKWRYEINDSLSHQVQYENGRIVSDVFNHPELESAYPDLFGISFQPIVGKGAGLLGEYSPPHPKYKFLKERIGTSVNSGRDTFLHELQHAIQYREGFPRGGSPDALLSKEEIEQAQAIIRGVYGDLYDELLDAQEGVNSTRQDGGEEYIAATRRWMDVLRATRSLREETGVSLSPAIVAYRYSAGEVEARNIERRGNMTADDRRRIPPWDTQDVPDHMQIIRFNDVRSDRFRQTVTNPGNSDMLGNEQKGVSDDRFVEDSPTAGREGIETGASQSPQGNFVGLRQSDETARSGNAAPRSSLRSIKRIIRQESARFDDDGSVIVGRRSTEAKISARSGKGGGQLRPTQRIGTTEKFELLGYDGSIEAVKLEGIDAEEDNLARLTYQVHSDGKLAAEAEVTQRHDGAWEIEFVISHERRKGLGTKLYDAIEKDLGIKVSPSGVLSDEGLAFWQKRSPASVQWHIPSPNWPEMHFSPAKLESEVSRTSREIRNLALKVGKARTMPADLHAELLEGYRKERRKLIEAWKSLPEEARAAKDSMFALRRSDSLAQPRTRTEVKVYHGIDGMQDAGGSTARQYAVWKQGTVRSAFSEDQLFALRGFYSPAIRAAGSLNQQKGTGEQFWKQITKAPGVRKDELDWIGLEEFLADKKAITKAEVLEFMKAHQIELDEKVLGVGADDIGTMAREQFDADFSDRSESFGEWLFDYARQKHIRDAYIAKHGEDAFDDADTVGIVREVEGQDGLDRLRGEAFEQFRTDYLEAAQRELDEAAEDGGADATKFSSYKIPGGTNYRELLIRLPDLGWGGQSSEWKRLEAERDKLFLAGRSGKLSEEEYYSKLDPLRARQRELEASPGYYSKHFDDQEIVHLRVDDRIGPNGEKTLFINEVQSDLHQEGRNSGYRPQSNAIVPNAPFKGDHWAELALKRALLYAVEGDYDSVSWATSGQIARAVGAVPSDLAMLYDKKIGNFFAKYTKKWGGKIEEAEVLSQLTHLQQMASEAFRPAVNPILRITPQMRASVLEGQPLALRSKQSTPQILTPEFKKWFGDSKVVDGNGRPLVVYHGTQSNINDDFSFKENLIGSSNDEGFFGRGFYFAKTNAEAGFYGPKVGGFYLSVKNPLDLANDTGDLSFEGNFLAWYSKLKPIGMTSPDVDGIYNQHQNIVDFVEREAKVLRAGAPSSGKVGYMAKAKHPILGEQTTRKLFNDAWPQTPEDAKRLLVEEFVHEMRYHGAEFPQRMDYPSLSDYIREWHPEGASGLTKAAKRQGHDGIFYGDEYIVFDPTQIKSATNNTGAFDAADPRVNNAMSRQPEPQALGRTDPYNLIISLAMEAIEAEAKAKSVSTEKEAVRVARHEFVEFFKASGMFADQEWALLERTARKNGWVETTGVRNAYTALYGEAFGEKNDAKLALRMGGEAVPRLSAMHNLTEENLVFADKMGGIAAPSIAVVKEGMGVGGFGDITLIGQKRHGDPEEAPVFDSDAWTSRFPKPFYQKVKRTIAQGIQDRYRNFQDSYGDWTTLSNIFDHMVKNPDPQQVMEYAINGAVTMAAFLHERGIAPDPAYKEGVDVTGSRNVDRYATKTALRAAIEGHESEYRRWIDTNFISTFGEPALKLGNKSVAYTLENIVVAMTGRRVKGQEKGMTFGEGAARAALSSRFRDLEKMRAAAGKGILAGDELESARKRAQDLLEEYRNGVANYYSGKNWRGGVDYFYAFDAAMRALVRAAKQKKGGLKSALTAEGFNDIYDEDILARGEKALAAFIAAPVPYFESKPQRAVGLSEFLGAVIPENASVGTKAILERHGIPYKTYRQDSGAESQTQAAALYAQELSSSGLDTLFALGSQNKGDTQQTKGSAALEQLLIKEAIAEQYGEFESGKKFVPAIAAIFQRIKAFLTRVMNSLRGMGFQTWEDVFTRIDSGEFAKRFDKAFEVEQQQAGADIAPMALPGTKTSLPLSPGVPEAVAMGDSEPTHMSLVDIQRRLRKRLGLTVGRGRLDPETARNAAMAGGKLMGQYNRKTDVIRLRTLEDFETETHEIAHALESKYDLDGLKQTHSAELDGVAAAVGQSGLSEGFAEFLRLYMTNPDAARAHAPLFFDAFEEHFDAVDQDLLQNLQEARDQYGVWRNAPSASRLQAAIKSGVKETYFEKLKKSTDKFTEVAGGFFNYLGDIYSNRWDDTNPFRRIALHIADIAEEKGQKIDLGAWKNPQNLAQKIRMADSAGYMDITKGVGWDGRSGHGETSLVSALSVAFSGQEYDQWAAEQRDAFGAYLIARRGRWLWMRHDMPMDRSLGRLANAPENAQHGDWYYDTMRRQRRVFLHNRWESELLHSPDKHASADFHQTIADHDAQNPQFEKAAQMVYAFLRDLALKRHQAGLDSTEEYEHKVGSADYVPWFRDMSDEMFKGSAGSGRKVAAKYKLKGSYRDFINPVEGIIRQVFDTSREVAVNKSKLALAELAEAVTGAGRYAEIIPATRMKVEEIRVRELLENTFRQQGIPPEDAKQMISTIAGMIGEDVVAKLYSQTQASEKGDAILHYMDGGELKMLQIHDDGRQTAKEILAFYEIAKGTPLPDHLMGMLSAAIRVPQKAITSAVGFQWKNIIRDMKNMTVLVRGYAPLVSNIQTIRENRTRRKAGDETYGDLIARHGGIMGGIGMTDTQMMRSGRILGMSELVNSKRTWLNYLNLSHENFWKWTEWSEANARQTVMRLSYKRALADAKHSYPNMPLVKQEFIALEAAAQKSRDYINYASIGAAKSQPTLNRTFMFLNPFLQGWSKIVRAAFFAETDEGRFAAASVIRKKLMPLFNEEYKKKTLTDKEVAALKDAFRMWVMVGIIACTHLLIELIFNTPEELKDKDELDRSMNVVLTIGGEPWRIPRGFDIVNIVSNLVRGTYDSWIKEDPTAWKRFREAALMSIMPPSSNPIIDAFIGFKHGRSNFMNRELEPDHLQGKLPGERVHSGTSMLAKDVSSAIKTITSKEFSPIMVDFSFNLVGAEWARDFARAYDLARPGAPALKWQQYPFVRSARGLSGSRGQTEFWGLMGKEGEFTMPARSYKSEAVVHQNWSKEEIRKFFDTRVKDDDAKAYAILTSHYDKDQQRLHPMARADEFISAISKTISEARLDRVDMKTAEKKAGRKVKERADLTPEERTAAIDILAEIRRREYVNALIALRRPGYEKDEPQPTKEFIEELKETAPEIWKSLSDKLVGKGSKPHIYDFEAVRNGWPAMRRTLLERNKINEIVEERGQVLFRDLKGEAAIARASGLR